MWQKHPLLMVTLYPESMTVSTISSFSTMLSVADPVFTSGQCIHRSSFLDQKKDWNWTEPNCRRLNHQLQLYKFWNFFGCQLQGLSKNQKTEKNRSRPVATSLSSRYVLDLIYTHIYLIFGPWIIKNGQELVEIWPKTFLYTTWMYVPSVFAISQPNLNEIAWTINQSTVN